MLEKDKAETILAEIKQKTQSGNSDSIAFSGQTILWMAESLVSGPEINAQPFSIRMQFHAPCPCQ